MGNLYDAISKLCASNGITGYRMCKDIGIQPSIMTDLKSGRKKGLSAENADKIASYFGVSVSYLLGTEKEKPATQSGGLDIGPAYLSLAAEMQEGGIHPDDVRAILEVLRRRKDDQG